MVAELCCALNLWPETTDALSFEQKKGVVCTLISNLGR